MPRPDAVRALTVKLGLDQPLAASLPAMDQRARRGDLGSSYAYGTPVARPDRGAAGADRSARDHGDGDDRGAGAARPASTTAANHNGLGDVGVMALTQVGIALPNFWFAILLILVFAVKLQWFSAGGFPAGTTASWLGVLKSLLLPAIALAVVQAAILARVTRSAVLEVLREDFVRTARAKGPEQARGAVAPRAAQRDDPGADGDGAAVRQPARRHDRDRERVRPAGARPADLPVDRQPRPDRGAQRASCCWRAVVVIVNFVVDLLYALIDPRLQDSL